MPQDLVANTLSASQIELGWTESTDNVGVTGYKIYNSAGVFLDTSVANTYTHEGLSASTYYCYNVSAHDAGGNESAKSAESCDTTLSSGPPVYDPPSNLTATSDGVTTITLDWDTVASACYKAYWNTTTPVYKTNNVIANITSPHVHSNAPPIETLYYAVTRFNCSGAGESGLSNEDSAVTNTPFNYLAKLTASDAVDSDYFGFSVSVSNGVAVSGAWLQDQATTNGGAAYVYHRDQGGTDNWGEAAMINAADSATSDFFGWSVAVSNNVAIVGAFREDNAETDAGSAYVFYRDQGGADNWGQVKKLTASPIEIPEPGDRLGVSVAIDNDVALVGAYQDDGTHGNSLSDQRGAAYVYHRDEGGANNWGVTNKLEAAVSEVGARFGWSVSVSNNIAVAGAYLMDSGGTDMGAAYVFYRDQGGSGNWGRVANITASDAADSDQFGYSISINNDTLVVGAPLADSGGTDMGAAYVFYRDQGGADTWGEVAVINAPDAADSDQFGYSVSVSGDYIAVGAPYADEGGSDQGAVYVFYRDHGGPDNWGQIKKLTASDPENDDQFGLSVSLDVPDAVVGAHYEDGSGTDQGAPYMY
jgi:hypothetical protein